MRLIGDNGEQFFGQLPRSPTRARPRKVGTSPSQPTPRTSSASCFPRRCPHFRHCGARCWSATLRGLRRRKDASHAYAVCGLL